MTRPRLAFATLAGVATSAAAQAPDVLTAPMPDCASCAEWNVPQPPFRIHGNTWYVGTRGLSAVLVTSPRGHVLLDAGLPESAPLILASIRALGFRPEDVKLVVNSHAHFDHAGGIAAVRRATGAEVAASARSAPAIETGRTGPDDPQHGLSAPHPGAGPVRVIADGDTVRVGPLALVAHFTPGHTPGGTSWSWDSCDGNRCVRMVYADSQTPISADGFLYSSSRSYPTAVADFRRGHALLERIRCDVLVTPHPSTSRLFERVRGEAALVDREGCRRYAATARAALARRLEAERTGNRTR